MPDLDNIQAANLSGVIPVKQSANRDLIPLAIKNKITMDPGYRFCDSGKTIERMNEYLEFQPKPNKI